MSERATERTRFEWLEELTQPGVFAARGAAVRETHKSLVFLTESRAYKLKKPLMALPVVAERLAARRAAAAHHPQPVIVRMSDFKSNEYAELLGGTPFEPDEKNPMIGWRGASRYYSPGYRDGFALECRAIARARGEMGFGNIVVMIPFCRTLGEADRVLEEMARHGLASGRDGLEIYVMCEIPANVILAERFAERFDGFSIGSNDLTQLTLGVDRDSDLLADLFDESDPAVTASIATLLAKAQASGTKTGLCGQAPSDRPDFAHFLVEHGIDSISVSPDSFLAVKRVVAQAESDRPSAVAGSRERAPSRSRRSAGAQRPSRR